MEIYISYKSIKKMDDLLKYPYLDHSLLTGTYWDTTVCQVLF